MTPSVSREDRLQARVVERRLEVGIGELRLPVPDVRVDGAADDRPRPDDRDLHRQVLELARPRARQHLHLGAAFDLEDAHGVAVADHVVDIRVVEVDAAEILERCRAARRSTRVHSSTSESMPSARKSILMKRASSMESLSHWQM